jgi:hypothetical protein
MRVLLGFFLGVFLTIGVAYVHDASTIGSSELSVQTGAAQQRMVNWDVVRGNWDAWSLRVRNTLNKLASLKM